MKPITTAALVTALLAGASFISMAAETPYIGYRVTKVVTLPGKNPRWDHMSVDPINRHLFIGRRADGLTVVNIDTGEVSSVPDTKGTNGAWAAPDLGIGLSDNGTAADVTVFDLKTLAVKGKIKVPKETDGVWYDPATKLGYVNNGDEGSITLFDPVAMKSGETIALNSKKSRSSAQLTAKAAPLLPCRTRTRLLSSTSRQRSLPTLGTWIASSRPECTMKRIPIACSCRAAAPNPCWLSSTPPAARPCTAFL